MDDMNFQQSFGRGGRNAVEGARILQFKAMKTVSQNDE